MGWQEGVTFSSQQQDEGIRKAFGLGFKIQGGTGHTATWRAANTRRVGTGKAWWKERLGRDQDPETAAENGTGWGVAGKDCRGGQRSALRRPQHYPVMELKRVFYVFVFRDKSL